MRKSDEVRLPHSYFNRADNDEPLFVLMGRDRSAPAAMRAWIADRLNSGKNKANDPQILNAHSQVLLMEQYADERAKKHEHQYRNEDLRGKGHG